MSTDISHGNAPDLGRTVADRAVSDDGHKVSYTIGDLAKEFDVTHRTLRFYEDRGMIKPRRQGTMRIYSRRDRARLKLILMGKRVGFSLDEIGDMLDFYDLRDGQVAQMRVAVDKFSGQIAILEAQKKDIEQAIDELRRTVEVVSGILREKEARGEE